MDKCNLHQQSNSTVLLLLMYMYASRTLPIIITLVFSTKNVANIVPEILLDFLKLLNEVSFQVDGDLGDSIRHSTNNLVYVYDIELW